MFIGLHIRFLSKISFRLTTLSRPEYKTTVGTHYSINTQTVLTFRNRVVPISVKFLERGSSRKKLALPYLGMYHPTQPPVGNIVYFVSEYIVHHIYIGACFWATGRREGNECRERPETKRDGVAGTAQPFPVPPLHTFLLPGACYGQRNVTSVISVLRSTW